MKKKLLSLLLVLLMLLSLVPAAAFAEETDVEEPTSEEISSTVQPLAEGNESTDESVPNEAEQPKELVEEEQPKEFVEEEQPKELVEEEQPEKLTKEVQAAAYGETLTANAEPQGNVGDTWTVTLDTNGGYFEDPAVKQKSVSVVVGSAVGTSWYVNSADQHLTFNNCWYLSADCSGDPIDLYTYVPTDNVTLYAGWTPISILTLHANGGYFNNDPGNTEYSLTIETNDIIYLSNYITIANSDAHKSLDGWYYDAACTQLAVSRVDQFTVTEDVALYAKWTDGWIVTLDAGSGFYQDNNGEEVRTKAYTVPFGQSMATNSWPSVKDEHMQFTGSWFLEADCSGDPVDLWNYVPTSDVTLYSEWKPVYIIKMVANGGYFYSDPEYVETTSNAWAGELFRVSSTGWIQNADPNKAIEGWYYDAACTQPVSADGFTFTPEKDVTIYAKWGAAWNVTLDANGGYFGDPAVKQMSMSVVVGSAVGTSWYVNSADEHLSFTGSWSLTPDGSGDPINLNTYVPNGNVTLYATWGSVWLVTFNANGGYFEMGNDRLTEYTDRVRSDSTIYEGDRGAVNSDEHLTFDGWYFDAACTQLAVDRNTSYQPTGDVTLYAKWSKGWIITFDANGGYYSWSGDGIYKVRVLDGQRIDSAPSVLNKNENYAYNGWSLTPGGENANVWSIQPTSDMTLYAIWVPMFPVTFHANGGYFTENGEHVDTTTARFSENTWLYGSRGVQNTDPRKTFDGWYYDAACTQLAVSYGEDVRVKYTSLAESPDLYAGWSDGWVITFHANGSVFGNNNSDTFQRTVHKNATIDSEPMIEYIDGYALEGWCRQPDCSDEPIQNLYAFTAQRDMDLYAKWAPIYWVTLNANGGYFYDDPTMTVEHFRFSEGSYLSGNMEATSANQRYSVEGWYYDAACTQPAAGADGKVRVTGNITLYAKWGATPVLQRGVNTANLSRGENYALFTAPQSGRYSFSFDADHDFNLDARIYEPGGDVIGGLEGSNTGAFSFVSDLEGGVTYALRYYQFAYGLYDSDDFYGPITITIAPTTEYKLVYDFNGVNTPGFGPKYESRAHAGLPITDAPYLDFGTEDLQIVEGWYFDAACTQFAFAENGVFIPSGDLTVYAKWVPVAPLSLGANTVIIRQSEYQEFAFTAPETGYYVFESVGAHGLSGYFPSAYSQEGSGTGSNFRTWGRLQGGQQYRFIVSRDESDASLGSVTIYVSKCEQVTLTFVANGGYFDNDPGLSACERTIPSNCTVEDIPVIAHSNPTMVVSGWYYDAACTQLAFAGSGQFRPTADMTVYAKWEYASNFSGLNPDAGGVWRYYENGRVADEYSGLVNDANVGWWYVNKGTIDFGYTGLVTNDSGTWYVYQGQLANWVNGMTAIGSEIYEIENGQVATWHSELVPYNGEWLFLNKGHLDLHYTGLASNANGWWYVFNGHMDFSFTGLVTNSDGTWYVYKGQLVTWRSGLEVIDDEVYEFDKGQLAEWHSELILYNGEWLYLNRGHLDLHYTGLASNANGWWYVLDGHMNFDFTGLQTNRDGTWYVYKGQLVTWRSGLEVIDGEVYEFDKGQLAEWHSELILYNGEWLFLNKGHLDLHYTGLTQNANGWWYVFDGHMDFTFTGLETNENGTWYVYKGQLVTWREGFEQIGDELCLIYKGQLAEWVTGDMDYNGTTVHVVNGKAV